MERGLIRPGKPYNLNASPTIIYVTVVCIACWVTCFLTSTGFPIRPAAKATPLWSAITGWLSHPEITYALGVFFLLAAAYLLLRANYALMLIRERTVLPFLLYLLYASVDPDFYPLNPASVGVFCVLAGIYLLFQSYHDEEAVENAYRAALFFGVGSLLWVHILWFLPLFWRGMYNFKTWSYKIVAASLFGLVTVYWCVLGWCVWQEDYTPLVQPFSELFSFHLIWYNNFGLIDWLSILLITLVTVIAVVHMVVHELEDNLRTRQFLWFLLLFSAWTLILLVLFGQSSEEFLQILCIPAAILTAHFFTLERNKYAFALFHVMVAVCAALLILRVWNF